MPLQPGDTWELRTREGDELVGLLRFAETDFPWVICDFEPTAAFESYRPTFERLNALADEAETNDNLWDEWDVLYQTITAELKLVALGNANPIDDFLLNIYDAQAHFRA